MEAGTKGSRPKARFPLVLISSLTLCDCDMLVSDYALTASIGGLVTSSTTPCQEAFYVRACLVNPHSKRIGVNWQGFWTSWDLIHLNTLQTSHNRTSPNGSRLFSSWPNRWDWWELGQREIPTGCSRIRFSVWSGLFPSQDDPLGLIEIRPWSWRGSGLQTSLIMMWIEGQPTPTSCRPLMLHIIRVL
jgi:hypothetical protein